jgi:hypothetical protein
VPCDGNDFGHRATSFGKHSDRGAARPTVKFGYTKVAP